ncbi:uncharacterized protein LOC135479595 [Liolophura sinensis]|uniref:uncharacterized protein LOC135479595 n=1 Tax=Liolophura sinensis TaxID=3198878 RepID=UPI0031584EDA
MWNISDISPTFCQSLCDSGFVNTFQLTLANHFKSERPFLNNDRVVSYAKCLLGILHNIVRQREDSHSILRQNLKLFKLFSLSDHLMIKTKATMILSYIVKESETSMITSNQETITFMTLLLRNALESPYHFSTKYGISACEVLNGLNNLAVNDSNKARIVDSGILPLYVSLLQPDCTDSEQLLAAKGLWLISFCKSRKDECLKSGCVEALSRLEKGDNEALCHAARGALWEIQNNVVIGQELIEPLPVEKFASPVNVPHVMISYQWDSKPIMLKVKDKLKDAGYKVWMDVEQMSGSTLEAMALAVEGAAVVIVAMSQKYKDSPSCRTEAEYTYKLRKAVLPLQVEPSYSPDGWLGMLVGTRLYISVYHTDQVDAALAKILSELGNRGKQVSPDNRVTFQRTTQQTEQLIQQSHQQEVGGILPNAGLSVDWRKWSEAQVADWLSKSGINRLSVFPEMDGSLLAELHRMYDRAPEVFFSMLKTELKLLLKERLQLSRALSSLP